jgi:CDP-diglyceride synthetase
MTFDNGKKIVLLRFTGFIITLIYVLYIFLAYFPRIFRNSMSESTVNIMTAVITLVYLLVLFRPVIMKYRYIYFSADESNITLRWYNTGLLPGESKSIEIPAGKFAGYEISKSTMGLHHYLTLYQQVQGRRASYTPVSISALSKKERSEIADTLNNYKSAV